MKTIVAAADTEPATWQYTTSTPSGDDWTKPDFDAKSWKSGLGGFGVHNTPGEKLHTQWNTDDIYLRREFTLPSDADLQNVRLYLHHDDDAEVYVNGILAAKPAGFTAEYVPMRISKAALGTLKPGTNTIAIHCHQTGGRAVHRLWASSIWCRTAARVSDVICVPSPNVYARERILG